MAANPIVEAPKKPVQTAPALSPEHEKIVNWLKEVKFEKKLVGGVDEMDVWHKFEELNAMYEAALSAERARCDLMIEQYRKSCVESIRRAQQGAHNG